MFRTTLFLTAIAIILIAASADAELVTSLPGGSIISMPAVNIHSSGPQNLGSGITWQSDKNSVFGWTDSYGFGDNGTWLGLTMAGLDSIDGTMTFSFSTPVSGVGGFLNYFPLPVYDNNSPTIAVYDADKHLIESATLDFSTGGKDSVNGGFFYGFDERDPIISSFTLSNVFIGITDLTVRVPEPVTLLLLGFGRLGIAGIRKMMKR